METCLPKLSVLGPDGEIEPHRAPRHYTTIDGPCGEALLIGAASDPAGLMVELAKGVPGPVAVLYVLLDPRGERPPGRFQSPFPLGRRKMSQFFERFAEFLEADGRHCVWILTEDNTERIIYDRHEVIYVYGSLKNAERMAVRRGYTPGPLTIPPVHRHHTLPRYDSEERRLLRWWPWFWTPLWPGDDA